MSEIVSPLSFPSNCFFLFLLSWLSPLPLPIFPATLSGHPTWCFQPSFVKQIHIFILSSFSISSYIYFSIGDIFWVFKPPPSLLDLDSSKRFSINWHHKSTLLRILYKIHQKNHVWMTFIWRLPHRKTSPPCRKFLFRLMVAPKLHSLDKSGNICYLLCVFTAREARSWMEL